ncbi:MAG: DMT family transporter [Candidatus Bathyarchaeia archaeon]
MLGLRNWLLFMLMALLWGSNWAVMKLGLQYVAPVPLLTAQYLFSLAAMSPVIISVRERIPRDKKTLVRLIAYSLLYLVQVALMRFGLVGETSGTASVLLYSQPLFVVLLSTLFLKEKATATKVLGALVGFAGVSILFIGKMSSLQIHYVLIMVVSAFLWAVETVYYKLYLSQVNPFAAILAQLLVGTFILLPFSAVTGNLHFPLNPTYLMIVTYSAVGSFAVGWSIWLFLLSKEDATVLSGSSLIVPLLALLIGWRVLGESVGAQSLLGATLTLCGVYLVNAVNRRDLRKNQFLFSQTRRC